ncbi:MAG: methyltransferase domain-containing protein, partial [Clostridia bacterium]|nr:methyltransferase domain-containing protein [Clostridia bacterium]
MKPAVLAQRLAPLTSFLRCPRCAAAFSVNDQSLICENRHCFDLSRRGYVNLAPSHDQAAEKYDAELFSSRRLVFERGFYLPVAEAIARHLPDAPLTVLDAGCGEGYYTRLLAERFPQAQWIGLDISRDAIT